MRKVKVIESLNVIEVDCLTKDEIKGIEQLHLAPLFNGEFLHFDKAVDYRVAETHIFLNTTNETPFHICYSEQIQELLGCPFDLIAEDVRLKDAVCKEQKRQIENLTKSKNGIQEQLNTSNDMLKKIKLAAERSWWKKIVDK